MSEKIPISYLALGLYLTFVIGSSLLVGLLPPLVNRPVCKPKETAAALEPLPIVKSQESPLVQQSYHQQAVDEPVLRPKRSINKLTPESKADFEARQKRAREAYENELKTNPLFARMAASRATIFLPECPEIQSPQPLTEYPWYKTRLPTNVFPVNYNIELLLTDLSLNLYDGFTNITFQVSSPATYLLLHNGINDFPNLASFTDRNGNEVALDCQGNFPYLRNDYYIIKPAQPLTPALAPYKVQFLFLDFYSGVENGIYKLDYGPKEDNATMFLSKFRPIDARRAYPVFDEPGMRATYDMTIYHPRGFAAAFNTPAISSVPDPNLANAQITKFATTPPMPPAYIGLGVFKINDFGSVTKNSSNNVPITLWARKELIDAGFGNDPLDMSIEIFDSLVYIFENVNPASIPPKIDILVVPKYPVEGIGHFGLVIIEEDKILFKESSASERDREDIALTIAGCLAEFWFGNFISHPWWDELWTQEGFAEYIRFRAVDQVYPEFLILDHFQTTEMIETIIADGYPASHPIWKPIDNPYEIEEYYDLVETVKTASILRMVEGEYPVFQIFNAMTAYLNANPWGVGNVQNFYNHFTTPFGNSWTVKDFFDRWTLQSNYPLVQAELLNDVSGQRIKFSQSRGLNTNMSVFGGEALYPSQWNFTWYIALDCSFGNSSDNGGVVRERDFYLDTREATYQAPSVPGVTWTWVHCDRKFNGFFELQYTRANWMELGNALKQGNFELVDVDRAQIIHNLFMNALSERSDYFIVRNVLEYIIAEEDYLPWRTLFIHINYVSSLLVYRKSFYEVSNFISYLIRPIELSIDPWNSQSGSHVQELLKETVINLACYMQDPFCIANVTLQWPQALQILQTGNFENAAIAPFARNVIYDYHMENTYDVEDWDLIFRDYVLTLDVNEQKKLIGSLTFSRLPWLLYGLQDGIGGEYLQRFDIFRAGNLLSQKPLGRELFWDKFRIEYNDLLVKYGEDDPRIGGLLLDITETFENEFLFYELLSFVFLTTTGATANARYRALETVSTNIIWLFDKEDEIRCAFSLTGGACPSSSQRVSNPFVPQPFRDEQKKLAFIRQARETFVRLLKDNDSEEFAHIKKRILKE